MTINGGMKGRFRVEVGDERVGVGGKSRVVGRVMVRRDVLIREVSAGNVLGGMKKEIEE